MQHLSRVTHCSNLQTEGVSYSRSPPAAGMATVDPLPLREDTWAEDTPELSPDSKPARKTLHKKASSAWLVDITRPHANRIQGTMRNPEFQHNGMLHAFIVQQVNIHTT